MKAKSAILQNTLPVAVAAAGVLAIVFWLALNPGQSLKERVPGADRTRSDPAKGAIPGTWQGKLVKGTGTPAELTGAWPQFRGANFNAISAESTPLARNWPASGPKVLWKLTVGEGFAGAAIWKGRAYLLDYDHTAQADALRCLSLADGQEIWRYSYPDKIKRNHGMSRTVPTVREKFVISLGPKCNVLCVDPVSGEFHWQLDMVKEFGSEVPAWYAGQCPLVDGDRLILGCGGDALMAAVDCGTGKVIWKSANPKRWQMTHSTPAPMEFAGKRMYVYCASGGVVGVAADSGALLWEYPEWKISLANIPTPVPVGGGRIFLSGGYNAGSMMLQLKEADGKVTADPLFHLKPTVFGATQHTPILYQDHLFGVRPDGELVCLDLYGKPVWESGPANKFGSGPFMMAQGLIFVMNDSGLLTLAEASLAGYKQLAQFKALEGPDAWGPMALADGRLILRDMTQMICLEVTEKPGN